MVQIIHSQKEQTLAKEIACSVLQGSNIDPLLFLIYINDLPNCLETARASIFADCPNILSYCSDSPTDTEHNLNTDLENANKWLTANNLTRNTICPMFFI